jgi:hypothetical protein
MRNYDAVMYGNHWSSTDTEETPDASVCLSVHQSMLLSAITFQRVTNRIFVFLYR